MADTPSQSRKPKVKQGHKLVWLTLIVIAIPCIIVGYVLLSSMEEQNSPVVGSRFTDTDISPSITHTAITTLESQLAEIPGVESDSVNLKSATLRIHLNMNDDASQGTLEDAVNKAYSIVNSLLPIETYFTNNDEAKMYDLQIDAYNYLVDDSHPADGQIIVQLTKTGAGGKVVDVLTTPKDAELSAQIKHEGEAEPESEEVEEYQEEYEDYGY